MCLAVPGRILDITDDKPLTRRAQVDFGGISREINLSFVPDAGPGDYVMVHAGFAITQVDEAEANRVFDYLDEIGELEEFGAGDGE